MGRRPIGQIAMTPAERQQRRRQRLRPAWDPADHALELCMEIEDAADSREKADQAIVALVAHLVIELGALSFSTEIISDGYRHVVTCSVTESVAVE